LPIAAGRTVRLSPDGPHIALFGLRDILVSDSLFPLTLDFQRAGAVTVDVRVAGRRRRAPPAR
jgi:hypothetical protein